MSGERIGFYDKATAFAIGLFGPIAEKMPGLGYSRIPDFEEHDIDVFMRYRSMGERLRRAGLALGLMAVAFYGLTQLDLDGYLENFNPRNDVVEPTETPSVTGSDEVMPTGVFTPTVASLSPSPEPTQKVTPTSTPEESSQRRGLRRLTVGEVSFPGGRVPQPMISGYGTQTELLVGKVTGLMFLNKGGGFSGVAPTTWMLDQFEDSPLSLSADDLELTLSVKPEDIPDTLIGFGELEGVGLPESVTVVDLSEEPSRFLEEDEVRELIELFDEFDLRNTLLSGELSTRLQVVDFRPFYLEQRVGRSSELDGANLLAAVSEPDEDNNVFLFYPVKIEDIDGQENDAVGEFCIRSGEVISLGRPITEESDGLEFVNDIEVFVVNYEGKLYYFLVENTIYSFLAKH